MLTPCIFEVGNNTSAQMITSGHRLFIIVILFLISISSYLLHHHLLNNELLAWRQKPSIARKNVTVLLWHWPFGRHSRIDGDKCWEMYNISHCFLSDNTSIFPTADVVVFHHRELKSDRSTLPFHLPRPASQQWVWLSLESPDHNVNVAAFNGLFNWTMTYRRDADIYIPYGKTIPGGKILTHKAPQNRTCLVSWVVSRYMSKQTRAGIYQNLKKYIPIEVYGHWNRRPLSNKQLLPTIGRCLFYLAFENSESMDYISEKLWRNAFQSGAVPVVLGPSRANYEALAPPGSFIHVKDFNSTMDLAAFLKSLAADRKAYERYFHWHRTHSIKTYTDWRERLCQICVNYNRLPTHKVYHDLDGWVRK
ncbi:alpha-(1,3)-fucosyltransferase 7 [Lampris incognitus]|uniref:alpha-(1,3)-fucosyltransferase 7 n=1 Tax=Lampris incognitus TaxID=2546036 RepID=UPI0024B52BC1|nr:alpha-(1,3)-fucosyltransferase 7 [Lampris incognitus]